MRWLLTIVPVLTCTATAIFFSGNGSSESSLSSVPDSEDKFAAAEAALSAGNVEESRDLALNGLALQPYNLKGYQILLDAATQKGDAQGQLHWGKWLYWSHFYGGRSKEAQAIGEQLSAIWPGWNQDGEIIAHWRASAEKAAAAAGSGSSKQFRLAGHLLDNLLSLYPNDKKLKKTYDKFFKKAGEEMTGGAFVNSRVLRKSPRWIEGQNKRHEDWDNAFERNTGHYKIITNISYEFFETVCGVMEDMHKFYRKVYGFRGSSPRMTLAIHRKRSDFDRYCQKVLGVARLSPGVGGWFYDRKMTLAAYDRTEKGENLEDLWRVLFHEASHQFMYLMTEKRTGVDPPIWLNEGTASYFEGCELKSDGSIVKNKPALNRIREWERLDGTDRGHTLEDLVKCQHRDYDGSYYSYGWAFVYFLNNYEDDQGNLVYREPYLKYLHSYTKKDKEPAFPRAVRMFVEEVEDPEVKTWEDLEKRWHAFTSQIAKESKAGPEFAETLHQRANTYLEKGDYERARIAAEQADFKRPNDPTSFYLLALSLVELGDDNVAEAIYWMFRYWEEAWFDGDQEEMQTAEDWLNKNGGEDIVTHYCQPSRQAFDSILKLAEETKSEHPAGAALFLSHAMKAFGMNKGLALDRLKDIREESQQDLRLWQRAYRQDPASNRKTRGIDVVKFEPDGVLINNPPRYIGPRLICRERGLDWLEPPYAIRGEIQIDGKEPAQILLGIMRNGRPQARFTLQNGVRTGFYIYELEEDDEDTGITTYTSERVGGLRMDPMQKIPFVLEVAPDKGGFLRVDKKYAKKRKDEKGKVEEKDERLETPEEWTMEKLTGSLAISTGDDTVALFSELEIRTRLPFWPVEPPADDK